MVRLSLLDLVPVIEGGDVATSLANAADLARHAESLGYHPYWVAEHHGMPETVRSRVGEGEFVERTGADELIVTCQMFDHARRKHNYEIASTCRAAK